MGITPVRRALLLAVVLGGGGLLGAACTSSGRAMAPVCSSPRFDSSLLVAQSVPTAERIPCITGYPAGWSLGRAEVRSGHASFVLHSDRAGRNALQVRLEAACDVDGAQEVATDEPGTIRHDRRVPDDGGFRELRAYRFPGGCVTYRFGRDMPPQLRDEASQVVGLTTRTEIDANARAHSNGRMHL